MSKKLWSLIMIVAILFVVSAACNLPFTSSNNDNNSNGDSQDNGGNDGPLLPGITNPLASSPDSKPVSFQEGLGSFDSYKIKIHILSSDATGSKTVMDEVIESSVVDENNHSVTTSTSHSAGDTEDSISTSDSYTIGTVTCTYSDGEWEYSKKSEQDKEISDVFSQMIDFVPIINNPEFIGKEDVNGVQTNHFTFKISGIGEKSGAVATVNQGDYWLAIDGQYIVKYTLSLQIQSAPEGNSEANISNMEVSYELYDVNVPVVLSQPAACVPTSE